ncbi:unnamed protein product [marine sediment metagenome]|uniref:DUF86 domain-containing protein n=1 Tax=marine sediment metagenome TaxID=412755 RepID=X1SFE5_9ZZZZ
MELLPEDRERLIRYVDFMESELSDFSKFLKIDWKTYNKDRDTRRNLERWIENIVNSSIDIAKVILALEDRGIPSSYKGMLKEAVKPPKAWDNKIAGTATTGSNPMIIKTGESIVP